MRANASRHSLCDLGVLFNAKCSTHSTLPPLKYARYALYCVLLWWVWVHLSYAGPPFTKRTGDLPQYFVKSRSREFGCYNDRIALKFHRHLGSRAAEMPVKFQSDWRSLNSNLAASILHEILRSGNCPLSEYRPEYNDRWIRRGEFIGNISFTTNTMTYTHVLAVPCFLWLDGHFTMESLLFFLIFFFNNNDFVGTRTIYSYV